MKIKKTKGEKIFDTINYILMALLGFCMLYPFWYVFVISLNDGQDSMRGGIYFWMREFTFDNYLLVLQEGSLLRAYAVTIFVTVCATMVSLLFCSLAAYAVSRKSLPFRRQIMFFIFFTNVFGGGLIPTYLLYRNIGLIDNILVYILPGAISFYNILLIKTYFSNNIPEALSEAASIDGAGESRIFFTIYMPLAKPILATITLFVAVGKWNDWFTGTYYIDNDNLITLGTLLRKMTVELNLENITEQQEAFNNATMSSASSVTSTSFKMATLMLTTLPILFAYPFLQKYFVKGVAVGSIKE